MTPRPSLVGRVSNAPIFRNNLYRRLLLGLMVVVFLALALFPQKYRGVVTLAPSDPSALGLSGTLLQLGGGTSVFAGQAALDLSIQVARSLYVRELVSKRLDLPRKLGKSRLEAVRWLEQRVSVSILRGGIIEIELIDRDPVFATKVVEVYSEALREQLGVVNRRQISYKRTVLEKLVASAGDRFDEAQARYDAFRRQSGYGNPSSAVASVAGRVPSLQQAIFDKQREIDALLAFGTSENMQIKTAQAQLAALRQQLAQARSAREATTGALGGVIQQSKELERLKRELELATDLYYNYKTFLQSTTVEDLTSLANTRLIEPAYVDPDRQFNKLPLAIAILILMMALAIEFYRLRPPVGDGGLEPR